MEQSKKSKEPTPAEWMLARAVVAELKELKVSMTDEQLHVVRCTIISHLIKNRDDLAQSE